MQMKTNVADYLCDTGQDCLRSQKGTSYFGPKNVAASGKVCMTWGEVNCGKYNLSMPYGSLVEHKNYCRSPTIHNASPSMIIPQFDGPWCFTSLDEYSAEKCKIEYCGK